MNVQLPSGFRGSPAQLPRLGSVGIVDVAERSLVAVAGLNGQLCSRSNPARTPKLRETSYCTWKSFCVRLLADHVGVNSLMMSAGELDRGSGLSAGRTPSDSAAKPCPGGSVEKAASGVQKVPGNTEVAEAEGLDQAQMFADVNGGGDVGRGGVPVRVRNCCRQCRSPRLLCGWSGH